MSTQSDPNLKAINIRDVENILETNRTITPLGVDGVFDSGWFDSEGYVMLNVLINTDAVGNLFFDFSMDGIVVDYTRDMPVPASVGVINSVHIVSSFIRVRYINGGVAQNLFRLSYTLTDKAIDNNVVTNSVIYEGDDTQLVRNANNYEVDILLSRVVNQNKDFISGTNPLIGTNREDIWLLGGTYNWLTAPTTLEIVTNDIDDGLGGAGANAIALIGLDENWDEITEIVLLTGNGTSSPTTNTFIRLNRAVVVNVGTLRGSNFNDIEIQASGGGVVIGAITGYDTPGNSDYGYGISQLGLFSIPRNKNFIVEDLTINVSGGKQVNVQAFGITNPELLGSYKTLLFTLDSFEGTFRAGKAEFEVLQPMTDIWFSGFTNNGSSAVDLRLYYKMIDVHP